MHTGEVKKILSKRKKVYQSAKALHPQGWRKGIRNWEPIEEVALNPVKDDKTADKAVV